MSLLTATQFYVAAVSTGEEAEWGPLLSLQLPLWGSWVLLTPLVLFLVRRFPLERGRLAPSITVHLFGATACGLLYIGAWMYWSLRIGGYSYPDAGLADLFWNFFRARFNLAFLIYWAILGIYYAFSNYRRVKERDIEITLAREELASAQLKALRLQLQPHFLFNTLHAVGSLMGEDIRAARRVLARLSELLRTTLEHDGVQLLPLEAELDLLLKYVEIEEIRFGDRLAVELNIDPAARDALVPAFLLQPLVENSIRHGIARRETEGRVRVDAERADGRVHIRVEDDGPDADADPVQNGRGIGLSNTRERLQRLYGDRHGFAIVQTGAGGCAVEIEIPFQSGADPTGPNSGDEPER